MFTQQAPIDGLATVNHVKLLIVAFIVISPVPLVIMLFVRRLVLVLRLQLSAQFIVHVPLPL